MPVNAYGRKKQPQVVRRAILDEAAGIAAQRGLGEVTIQAVAAGAGVTKGGVFHHFASKQALLEAMFDDMLEKVDAEIEKCLQEDKGHGCFTRAYVLTLTVGKQFGIGSPFDAMGMALMSNAGMSQAWQDWLDMRLERHRDTDSDVMLEIVRFAADGAWLSHLGRDTSAVDLQALSDRLLAMTRS